MIIDNEILDLFTRFEQNLLSTDEKIALEQRIYSGDLKEQWSVFQQSNKLFVHKQLFEVKNQLNQFDYDMPNKYSNYWIYGGVALLVISFIGILWNSVNTNDISITTQSNNNSNLDTI